MCFRSGSEGRGHLKGRWDADIIPAERHSPDAVGGESAARCSDQAWAGIYSTHTHIHMRAHTCPFALFCFSPVCLRGPRLAFKGYCLQSEPARAIPYLPQPSRTLRCSQCHVHLNPAATADHRRKILRQCRLFQALQAGQCYLGWRGLTRVRYNFSVDRFIHYKYYKIWMHRSFCARNDIPTIKVDKAGIDLDQMSRVWVESWCYLYINR